MWETYLLNLEHLAYSKALNVMRAVVSHKCTVKSSQVLMLVEHEPVVTLGRRSGQDDFVVSEACLYERGIQVHRIERGGLATYHGPGQLVAYPVFDLHQMKLGVVQLVDGLEQSVIDVLADFGVTAKRRSGYRGVWVGEEKIASVGIAVRRGISFHGIALNYAPNLDHFNLIHPCGIQDVRMTSMTQLLSRPITAFKVRQLLCQAMTHRFNLTIKDISLEQLNQKIPSLNQ